MRKKIAVCVVAVCLARVAEAQDQRVWVDVNVGVAASAASEESFSFSGPLFGETSALAASYPKPSTGAAFDVGAGYMFAPRVGVGISFSGAAHDDEIGLGISVPHPFFFNASATDGSVTSDKLTRTEGATHLQVMVVPLHTDRLRVRVFGGPSFFRYKADMVQDIEFSQVASLLSRANTVTITGYQSEEAKANGWGIHGGADVSWFFSRVVGVGGFARYARGSVSLDVEPLSEEQQDITVGGLQAGGGLRLRF